MTLTVDVTNHLQLNLTYQLKLEANNVVETVVINDIKFIWSDKMTKFLSTCFGTYEVDINRYTLTFEDSRDYTQYCLTISS